MSRAPRRAVVSCYAGYRGEQEPRQFSVDDQRHTVADIPRRWREPDADYFEVRTTDGQLFRLRRDHRSDSWTAAPR